MPHVYIGLGSNLDNPEAQLLKAIKSLKIIPDTAYLCNSSFYRSKPVGSQDQPDYINAVVMLNTNLPALSLLERLQAIEIQQGRTRGSERWGPRTIDLDLLLYGDEQINHENLIVPHREMHKRNFVLYPLHEIDSELVIPGKGPVAQLFSNFEHNGIEKIG
jgi:2-amino-4-hydroxy-6-hydroxymethyldihydropteridine diphosphokinase